MVQPAYWSNFLFDKTVEPLSGPHLSVFCIDQNMHSNFLSSTRYASVMPTYGMQSTFYSKITLECQVCRVWHFTDTYTSLFSFLFSPRNGGAFVVYKSVFSREGPNCLGPGKSFWREIQMVGFSTDKGQTALVSWKKFWREIQMVGLDIMGMMDMGCISRNLMSLKDFAVHG